MNKEEFITKWKEKFRPDLNLPTHTQRKMLNIYKKEMFEDLYDLLEKNYEENVEKDKGEYKYGWNRTL